jgi:hypothetical protein
MIRKIVEIVGTMQKLTLGEEQLVCLSNSAFEELVTLAESAIDLEREISRLQYELYKLNLPKTSVSQARRNNPDDLLNQKEVAAEWGVSEKALEKWRLTGEGPPYIKMGKGRCGRIRYRRSDVSKFVEEQYREHTSHDTAIRAARG